MKNVVQLVTFCALAGVVLSACASPRTAPAADERFYADVGELEAQADLIVAGTLTEVDAASDNAASSFVGDLDVTGTAKGSAEGDMTFRMTNASTREEDRADLVVGRTYVLFLETFNDDTAVVLTPGQAVFDATDGRYLSTNGSLTLTLELREKLGV